MRPDVWITSSLHVDDGFDWFRRELDEVKPTHVINAAGLAGDSDSSVDWCEGHKAEAVRVNVISTMSLMDLTHQRGIHMTNFTTG